MNPAVFRVAAPPRIPFHRTFPQATYLLRAHFSYYLCLSSLQTEPYIDNSGKLYSRRSYRIQIDEKNLSNQSQKTENTAYVFNRIKICRRGTDETIPWTFSWQPVEWVWQSCHRVFFVVYVFKTWSFSYSEQLRMPSLTSFLIHFRGIVKLAPKSSWYYMTLIVYLSDAWFYENAFSEKS